MSIVHGKNRKWWGLFSIMPALAMIFADQSILPVALPTIQEHLKATNVQLLWSVNSYLLAMAVLVLIGGKIADRIGHRRGFLLGMLLFALSSAFCGVSQSPAWLIIARAVQGIGAAIMMPSSMSLQTSLFPPQERGKATGIYVSVSSLFLILGPVIGGYLTQNLSWRWIFWVNLPLAALGFILVLLMIPRSEKRESKIDGPGFLFFLAASSSLVLILMQGRVWGWTSGIIGGLALFFLISVGLLFWREKRASHPFLDISLYKHPIYRAANISLLATAFMLMITVFWTLFFRTVRDYSPVETGLITCCSSLPVLFMAPLAGLLADRFGPKVPVAIGFLLLIYSAFWISLFNDSSIGLLLFGLFAFGIGIPFVLTPSFASAMNSIPKTKFGTAAGSLGTVRCLASALGLACIGSFIDNAEAIHLRSQLGESVAPAEIERLLSGTFSSGSLSSTLVEQLRNAQLFAFSAVNLALAFLLIAAFACVFVLYHRKSSHHLPEAPAEGWD